MRRCEPQLANTSEIFPAAPADQAKPVGEGDEEANTQTKNRKKTTTRLFFV